MRLAKYLICDVSIYSMEIGQKKQHIASFPSRAVTDIVSGPYGKEIAIINVVLAL